MENLIDRIVAVAISVKSFAVCVAPRPRVGSKLCEMERRVLFIANPVPLLCSGASGGRCSGATSRAHKRQRSTGTKFQTGEYQQVQHQDQITTVAQDLRHLRRVLDHISLFCKAQQSLVADNDLDVKLPALSYGKIPTPKPEPQRAGANPVENDNSSQPGLRSSSGPRVLLAAVFPCPPAPEILTGSSGSHHTAHVTSDICNADGGCGDGRPESSPDHGAAALTPGNTSLGVPEETNSSPERENRVLELAKAFADVLENGCGVWLPLEEYEARVLAPTRALVEAQLDDDSTSYRRRALPSEKPSPVVGEDRTPPAVITVSAATGSSGARGVCEGALSSADSGNTPRRLSSAPTATSSGGDSSSASLPSRLGCLARDTPTGLVGKDAESLGAFVRGAAEDMVLLLREAAGIGSGGGEGEGVRTSKACGSRDVGGGGGGCKVSQALLNVIWAASSMPLEDEGEVALASCAPALVPTRASDAATLSRDSRLETVDEGVGLTRTPAPALVPRLTLSLPAAFEEQAAPLREALRMACCHSPGSRVVIWPAVPVETDGISDGDEGNEDYRNGEYKDSGGGGDIGCRGKEWRGARPVVNSETPGVSRGSVAGEEGRLRRLWASWCESTGARLFLGGNGEDGGKETVNGSREKSIEHEPFEPGLLWRGPVSAGPSYSPTPSFPALEGFSLRVTPSWLVAMMEGEDRVRGVAGVGSSVASVLAHAPALRLARAISPAVALRSCHLLADGMLAPALELSVCDRDRFPGSAAFLQRCAANRTGLLLVAAAPLSVEACVGRGQDGLLPERKEERLAMVCFPSFPQRWKNKAPDNASAWSVTLFRRTFEFSDDAVDALVEESGAWEMVTRCRNGSACLPPSMGVSFGETKSNPSSLSIAVEGKSLKEEKSGGIKAEGESVASSIASLPVYKGDELSALRIEVRHFLGGAKVLSPPPAARDFSSSDPGEEVVTSDATPNSDAGGGDGGERIARSKTSCAASCAAATAVDSRKRRKIDPWASVNGNSQEEVLPMLSNLSAERGNGVRAEVELSSVARAARLLRGSAMATATTATKTVQVVRGDHAARDGSKLRDASAPEGSGTPASAFFCPSAATAIYASFGAWHDHGVGCDVRLSWAEEALLPGAARSRPRPRTASASASGNSGVSRGQVVSSLSKSEGVFEGGVSRGEKPGLSETREGVTQALAATAESGAAGEAASSRPLSTAEQALEKARERQRARKMERRMVAKEQRARMSQPRPRPRVPGSASSGGVGIGPGKAGGGSKYRRGGSLTARATSSGAGGVGTGALGRSVSGSKLCRGSLILGRSVGGDIREPIDPKMAPEYDEKTSKGGGGSGSSSSVRSKVSQGAAGITGGENKEEVFLESRRFYREGERGEIAKDKLAPGVKKAADSGRGRRVTLGSSGSDGPVRRKILKEEGPTEDDGDKCKDATKNGKRNTAECIGMSNGGRDRVTLGRAGGVDGVTAADRDPGTSDSAAAATSCGEGFGGVGGSHSTMRQVMERAMLSAIASQMGLAEEDPRVREVFERESRMMSGTGDGAGRRK